MEHASFEAAIASETYDFLDFGCSKGGSIERSKRLFGGRCGLGLDLDPDKVTATLDAGFDAVVQDLTDLGACRKQVRFVTMAHFLEHLPTLDAARTCVLSALGAAREFIFIRQPYFDADGYLFEQGLKLYWSNWTGHTLHMTSLQLHDLLTPLQQTGQIQRFAIYAQGVISDSDDDAVHPISSPMDQHQWQADVHPARPWVSFRGNVYRQIKAVALLDRDTSLEALQKRFNWDKLLYDSAAPSGAWSQIEQSGASPAQPG